MLSNDDMALIRAIFEVPTDLNSMCEVCDRFVSGFDEIGASSLLLLENGQLLYLPLCSAAHREAFQDPDYLAELASYNDVYATAMQGTLDQEPFQFSHAEDNVPPHMKEQILHINQRLEDKFGCYHQIGTPIAKKEKFIGVMGVTLFREADTERFMQSTKPRQMVQLISDAFNLVSIFQTLQTRYQSVLSVLDHLLLGAVITDHDLNILISNKKSDEIIDGAPGANRKNGKLQLTSSARVSVENAIASFKARRDNRIPGTFTIGDGDNHERFSGFVKPLQLTRNEFDTSTESLVFILIDNQNSHIQDLELTSTTLQLTPAERETLQYLMQGDTYKVIAEKRNVRPETTKSQVAAILEKSHCERVHQLILKVARLDTPFDFS